MQLTGQGVLLTQGSVERVLPCACGQAVPPQAAVTVTYSHRRSVRRVV